MAASLIALLVLFCVVEAPSVQAQTFVGRALMARSINAPPEADAAVELKMDDFNTTLSATPASWAVVEFFAHWCPACRNYKPQYEQVARLFNGRDAVHPGTVYMAKVDCALQCR